ncbi:DeoR family transcriptional regulator, partial [Kineococcus sp. G2]|uniref:DeoR family transcriptional regulator n=1 Tax=Kineococcus sp. G2 TaxID=3127484 RepID=UPI00301DAB22
MSVTENRRLLPATRRAQVLDVLRRHGTVRISELVDELGVTAITLRRDIEQLAAEGLLQRVHGGATLPPAAPTAPGSAPGTVPAPAPAADAG